MCPAGRFALADTLQILDALPMGLLMVSPERTVLHMNRSLAGLTGQSAEEVRGLPCRHVLRSRLCVAGCPMGCDAFRLAGRDSAPMARPGLPLHSFLHTELPDLSGLETDILTLKKRKVPVELTHLPILDSRGKELFRLDMIKDLTEVKQLEERLQQSHGFGKLVGKSAAMERIITLIPTLAASPAPIFLSGETGTGKDILAEALHQASPRSREPFIRLNVSPLPDELLYADLFGQAAQGAADKPGRIQQASGGTLYISELADIPKSIQAKLVDFIDSGLILPLGAPREIPLNVRLMAATNRTLEELAESGLVGQDLLHRLNVVPLTLPPLRERVEDIDFLLSHFLEIYAFRFKKSFNGFSPEARRLLAGYPYPGNVRELKNIVEYAVMVCPGDVIGVDSLPAHLGLPVSSPGRESSAPGLRKNAAQGPEKKRKAK